MRNLNWGWSSGTALGIGASVGVAAGALVGWHRCGYRYRSVHDMAAAGSTT